MAVDLEQQACTPVRPLLDHFNPRAQIPYGVTIDHVYRAMVDFTDFLGVINQALRVKKIERLEAILMPANFSSVVGEFVCAAIPKHCPTIVKNTYHNGHPDLLPAGAHPGNAMQHHHEGIEIKASRYVKAWQGHNAENVWLMVFMFDGNRPSDAAKGEASRPFRFISVYGAQLTMDDWKFSGRSETSRRTITASVLSSGFEKMTANWIYEAPNLGLSLKL